MALQPGQQFGRYELMFRLGHGGMAETWRARLLGEAGVTKPVLIKKILPEYATDEAFTTMFISEARISATLSHGNIAQVYDFGRLDDEYFLAMEFVDGQPLHRLIQRAVKSGLSSIPIPLATFIAIEMCRGLHYAHTRTDNNGKPLGIVHRDISPDNVLVSYEGQVKIVDFGIAKARELRGFNTEPGVVKGKYLFFSPEQARGEEVDARTDVWATGIVLYEMLCAKLPVKGPEYAALPKLIQGEFPRPRGLNPEVPEELEDIVMRALAVRKQERYESCNELGDALAGFLYSTAPRFSAMTLSHFIQELFREDLSIEGRTVQVPHAFQEQLALWRSGPGLSAPRKQPARPSASLETSPETTPERSRSASWTSRKMLTWGAGGVTVALLASGAGFLLARSPHPQGQKGAEALEAAPGAHVPGTPIDEAGAETSPPPGQTLSLPARRAHKNAYVLFQQKQYGQAISWLKECVNLEPTNTDCQLLAGDAYAAQGTEELAVQHYRKFLELAPQHAEAPRVSSFLAQSEKAQAQAAADPQAAKAAAVPQVQESAGPQAAKAGATPSKPQESASEMASDLLIRQANANVVKGNYKAAETIYREALKLQPGSLVAKEGLGFCLVKGTTTSSGYKEAVRLLRDAVNDDGVNPRAWYALGMALQVTQQYDEATAAYTRYLALEPSGKYSRAASLGLKSLAMIKRR